ncbi:uncharacterized protein SRS1_21042 [Sporisorium reilianum f. sp. reilianum]|uniref:3-hydroxyacyl-CoA dehydrogenase n=1 Tax=Sporisorium reilianum f. sp. reilianum TaxID=72559 RepID=A0A2N8ULZ4_9BASI|nr:uncharacterized protein SRS1_21042 [Sporisorium reilianum f. sp. reilianum]
MVGLLLGARAAVARPFQSGLARSFSSTRSALAYKKPASVDGLANTVIGAGTLGRRIALMWLTQGQPVHLFDQNPKALEDAKGFIDQTLPGVLKTVPGGKPGVLKQFTDREEAIKGSWVVTECVPEILDLKIKILGELDAIIPEDVVLATNSSSYMASEVYERVKYKDRLVNTHYYMPPQATPVEIMPNSYTSPDIAPLFYEQAAKHGLHPYHVRKESVGLIANRIWAAIKRESLYVAAEGVAKPEEVDSLLMRVFGFKTGPFAAMDGVGLDVGKKGVKSGEGFYKHPKTQPHEQDHLIVLELVKGEVSSLTTQGTLAKKLVTGLSSLPDGVQFDPTEGYVYWTNMGPKGPSANDGSLQRIKMTEDVDSASDPETIVAPGQTHTPKQLHLARAERKLYWCDREGGRIQRSNLDGSSLETLYDSAPGKPRPLTDQRDWCVGITVDQERNLIYWTQKGGSKGSAGRILRANKELPEGSKPESRTDIETLFDHLPEPIDLELDQSSGILYWTDRGDPPFGNTLNRFTPPETLDPSRTPAGPSAKLVIGDHLHEAIGLTLDAKNKRIYVADLLGSIYSFDLDGKNKKVLVSDQGNFTGLVFVEALA